jgi:hypothetical protein
MSEFFEIAYAAVNRQLCLFTGTGFSKAVSNNEAPSWQGLLETFCDKCDDPGSIRNSLFPPDGNNPLSLEESAQVLSIELTRKGLNLHEQIAAEIRKLKLKGDNSVVELFCKSNSFRVITTNYDKLIEALCGDASCQSLTPGLPIPRSEARVMVYHVHGSIDVPENMVVTADDYFRFLNAETYFSRKLSTVLHENTVVILGYSLGDTNLKAIMNDYRGFARNNVIGSNIFMISRSAVDHHIKDYYSNCYGIRVIDSLDVPTFFANLNSQIPAAAKCNDSSQESIKKVLFEKHAFTEPYLKLPNSFYEIVSAISAIGLSIDDKGVVSMLGTIIGLKVKLSKVTGAWEQYAHLAQWLIYMASILEITGTSIQDLFLDAVKFSMATMSHDLVLGYSWQAYKAWSAKWDSITPTNRILIRNYISKELTSQDAISIVSFS